jgi:hypothetical protein
MVFLMSHVMCSEMTSLQYPLLRMMNDYTVENSAALKLKAQALGPFLERCNDTAFVTELLAQDAQIEAEGLKRQLVQIVGVGASAGHINILLDLVRSNGPLAAAAMTQLAALFPETVPSMQLQIVTLLMRKVENAPPVPHNRHPLIQRLSRKSHQELSIYSPFQRLSFKPYWRTSKLRTLLEKLPRQENVNGLIPQDPAPGWSLRDYCSRPVD